MRCLVIRQGSDQRTNGPFFRLTRSQKIAEEELQCKAMAEVALAELEEVLPVLEEAVRVTNE